MSTATHSSTADATEAADAAALLETERTHLRLVVAGSVDDGKSTLVGRLLFDTKSILADTFEAISDASRRRGAEDVDLALLTDGLTPSPVHRPRRLLSCSSMYVTVYQYKLDDISPSWLCYGCRR